VIKKKHKYFEKEYLETVNKAKALINSLN